jgi:hypothetical protein
MICNTAGCERSAICKGLCARHYNRQRFARVKAADPERWRKQKAEARARAAKRRPRAAAQASRKCRSGFTEELVQVCLAAQKRACRICSVPLTLAAKSLARMHCDHCHVSGKPRGLLCAACNSALGYYERSQRPAGLRIAQYEMYLHAPTISVWGNTAEVAL